MHACLQMRNINNQAFGIRCFPNKKTTTRTSGISQLIIWNFPQYSRSKWNAEQNLRQTCEPSWFFTWKLQFAFNKNQNKIIIEYNAKKLCELLLHIVVNLVYIYNIYVYVDGVFNGNREENVCAHAATSCEIKKRNNNKSSKSMFSINKYYIYQHILNN